MAVTSIAGFNYDPSVARRKLGSVGAGGDIFEEAIAATVAPLDPAQQTTQLLSPPTSAARVTSGFDIQPSIGNISGSAPINPFSRYLGTGAAPIGTFGGTIGGPFDQEGAIRPLPIDDEIEVIEDENDFNEQLAALDPYGDYYDSQFDADSPNYDPQAVAHRAAAELFTSSTVPTSSQIHAHAFRSGTTASEIHNSMLTVGKPEDLPFGIGNLLSNSFIGQVLNAITTAAAGPSADRDAITAAVGRAGQEVDVARDLEIGLTGEGRPATSLPEFTEEDFGGFFDAPTAEAAAAEAGVDAGVDTGLGADLDFGAALGFNRGGQISFMGMKK